MPKPTRKGRTDKRSLKRRRLVGVRPTERRLLRVLNKVERTSSLIRIEAVQMKNLAQVLDHWGELIKVSQVVGRAVSDSEQWVEEIKLAIQAMTKRTVSAAKKLRRIIAVHENNGT